MKPCLVFIDESGDTGIAKIRSEDAPGSSPYFVIAAAVMPNAVAIRGRKLLTELVEAVGKDWKHATDLGHFQKLYICRESVSMNARFFAVVSKKKTLGEYGNQISWRPHQFYNKCATYLLECVGHYLAEKNLTEEYPLVYFEERNHDYEALRKYVGTVRDNPQHERSKHLSVFNTFALTSLNKSEEPLLKFADLVSHSVYQCVNKTDSNFGIPEPRYYLELSRKFGADARGVILNHGLKCIHTLSDLSLDRDIEEVFRKSRAAPMVRDLK